MTDENNELILSAMGILTHAGDARLHTKEALKYVQALQLSLIHISNMLLS